MQNKVQLIAYADRLGASTLQQLHELLNRYFPQTFGGIHVLPFYYPIDGQDAGFDPIDHQQVDPRLGTWADIRQMGTQWDMVADLIVNHVSAQSPQFVHFLEHGAASPYAPLFLTFDKVFPQGATQADLLAIYRPRPGFPFTRFRPAGMPEQLLWTTFTSNQIDIDIRTQQAEEYLTGILQQFAAAKVRMIRLDAVGYAVKRAATSCFMTDETFAFIEHITQQAKALGIEVLVEIHSYYKTQIEIAAKVDYVYDFALPTLVLHTLLNRHTNSLRTWLQIAPRNAITVLDTHDGIGIIDVAGQGAQPGLIDDATLNRLVDTLHENTQGNSRKATGAAASNLDLYQVNSTYYDALGRNDRLYLVARALQFFAPGIPQVYYVGLLAGHNDMELLQRTNVGRDINRHYYTADEIAENLKRPVVQRLLELIRLRNEHPAFGGQFAVAPGPQHLLLLAWHHEAHYAQFSIDFQSDTFAIEYSTPQGTPRFFYL